MLNRHDQEIISLAFSHMRNIDLIYGDEIPWAVISAGFTIGNDKILIANKARGIFKPKQLSRGLLSIKTTLPRAGRTNIYQDIQEDEGYFRYSLQRGDPKKGGNKNIREAFEDKSPFIYFFAISESVYKSIWPCFVSAIHEDKMYCEITVGQHIASPVNTSKTVEYKIPEAPVRSYAVRESKVRLHQAIFRKSVLMAYDNKCAISDLPVVELLEVAHIIPDSAEDSSTEINNGIALSRIHHRAYDANLIGIDQDYKIHISDKLMTLSDGVLLELGLKAYQNKNIRLPIRKAHWPNQESLAHRYDTFKKYSSPF